MTIEIRQLVIKSTVQSEPVASMDMRQSQVDILALKEELMAECRELVSECLRESVER
ncbi:MAG: DUF5908 family protein [Gammaproteobacteria bacterium]|nr:DUF5908 family protein [Gammaproteobacteria bacterium]MCF6260307.1 DUF5908 family protein [Gammaproteobacteria bacterium]